MANPTPQTAIGTTPDGTPVNATRPWYRWWTLLAASIGLADALEIDEGSRLASLQAQSDDLRKRIQMLEEGGLPPP